MNLLLNHRLEPAVCPRCKGSFECRADNIRQCQCQTVSLTDEQRQYINSVYSGCLCANCLLALRTETERASS